MLGECLDRIARRSLEGLSLEFYAEVSNVVCVLLCILSAAGIAGNMITHLYMREYKTWLSKSILCSDSFYLLLSSLELVKLKYDIFPPFLLKIFPVLIYPFHRVFQTLSVYLRLALLLISVTGTQVKGWIILLGLVAVSLIVNYGKFLETKISTLCWDFRECNCGIHIQTLIQQSSLWNNRQYVR
ncbi:uncharacterized protein LOC111711642 [Eurytemora carolleeae]|uniref:uncharacterized protein LOC111711642 n=1 Tax=Eurytemora carolleeae TaxID=1294199 RepID=UPI000C78864B|nr:uncharacterized protein LOC111711642 [Eurytemora carolleeae]|eukprot:XP_023341802.1 uncharacterized protein LOC111711642 [Eurytemora affinis]